MPEGPAGAGPSAFLVPQLRPGLGQGGTGYNSWYGSGEANAFKAVTHDPSNR